MTRITLRLPDRLHRRLAAQASKQERSLNRQIVYLLSTGGHMDGVGIGIDTYGYDAEPEEEQPSEPEDVLDCIQDR